MPYAHKSDAQLLKTGVCPPIFPTRKKGITPSLISLGRGERETDGHSIAKFITVHRRILFISTGYPAPPRSISASSHALSWNPRKFGNSYFLTCSHLTPPGTSTGKNDRSAWDPLEVPGYSSCVNELAITYSISRKTPDRIFPTAPEINASAKGNFVSVTNQGMN